LYRLENHTRDQFLETGGHNVNPQSFLMLEI